MSQTTVVFQPFATDWLGHTSRLIAVAQSVRRLRPDVRSVFLAEGNASILAEASGFPCVNLPHRAEYAGPAWGPWPTVERDRMLQSMARALLEQLAPSVVVFDTNPLPHVADETARMKLPAAFVARRSRTPARCFEIAVRWWPMLDVVIAPHDEGEMPVPAEIAARTHFVGTIVRETSASPRAVMRTATSRRVVITGGGGGYAGTVDYYNLALAAAHAAIRAMPGVNIRLITGPMFREWRALAAIPGVEVVVFDADIAATFMDAELVICQGGYNTLAEVVPLGTPVICVPAPRVADDQFARAHQVAALHSHVSVFEGTSADALRDLVVSRLTTGRASTPAARTPASSRGADMAATLILDLCRPAPTPSLSPSSNDGR